MTHICLAARSSGRLYSKKPENLVEVLGAHIGMLEVDVNINLAFSDSVTAPIAAEWHHVDPPTTSHGEQIGVNSLADGW